MVRKHFETSSRGKINDGRLIKQGLKYYVRYMNEHDLTQSLGLQDHVVDTLKNIGKSHYIIPKSRAKLQALLDDGHAVIGTFIKDGNPLKKDRLAAHMIVTYPATEEEVGLADPAAIPDKDVSKISVVSNILVHQDYRGNKLMQQMLAEWLKIAKEDGKSHAIAEASADNQFSWSVFLDCGFVIYGSAFDPRDGTENFFLHKPLDHEFVYSADPSDVTMVRLFDKNGEFDEAAYESMKDLLSQGYHAPWAFILVCCRFRAVQACHYALKPEPCLHISP